MTEVPKIVRDRLRAASLERALPGHEAWAHAHPDADLLAGFAEQALSATERDSVLEHLSRCGDCRDLVALSLPAAEVPPATNAVDATLFPEKARGWLSAFTAPSLRWATLAAGVAIVAAMLVMRPGTMNRAKLSSVSPQVATTASLTSAPPVALSSTNESINQPAIDQSVATLESKKAPKPQKAPAKKLGPGHDATPVPRAESGTMLAGNQGEPSGAAGLSGAPLKQGANETVEVAAAASGIQTETSTASEDVLMAQNSALPVIKSKPVVGTEASQAQSAISASAAPLPLQGRNVMSMARATSSTSRATVNVPANGVTTNDLTTNVLATNKLTTNKLTTNNVTWAITAGVLQRSVDGGLTWLNATLADHTLLCYASHEQEVWTGGQAGVLFHSADGGLTWIRVQPFLKTRQLTSDITHIELRSPLEIVVSTVGKEVWSSADGGRSWEKK